MARLGTWSQAAVIVAASVVAGAVVKAVHPGAPAFFLNSVPLGEGETDLETVQAEWGADGVLWIDARPSDKFAAGHVPDALLLNEQDWDNLLWEAIERLQTTETPVVVYCGAHACQASHKIATRLRQTVGLDSVWVLRGGTSALKKAGLWVEGASAH